MTDTEVVPLPVATSAVPMEIPAAEKRRRWFELGLVLLIAFAAFILQAIYLLVNGPEGVPHLSSTARFAYGITQEAGSLLLLGYVLSRRGLRIADLGLRWSVRDAGVGLLLAVLSYVAYRQGYRLVYVVHFVLYGAPVYVPSPSKFFGHPPAMAIPFSLLNPFFEELIVRAYLMTEIIQLTGSTALAVILSVLLQTSYHLYYGWAGAISVSFVFLVSALYYGRKRLAFPIIVSHAVNDLYGIIRLWS